MKNKEKWKPTIYSVDKCGKLCVTNEFLKNGSEIVLRLQAQVFGPLIEKYANGKLLDLGCGDVPLYGFYKKFVTENICVDWASTLHKNEYLDFECDITKELPFEDASFDTILSTQVLEHIYNPFPLFKECNRILKQGGVFIVSSNMAYWEHEQPNDYLRHTRFFYERVAKENGFMIEEIVPIGDGLCVLADISQKIARFEKMGKMKLLFRLLYKFTKFLFERYNQKMGKYILGQEPLGYCAVLKKI